MVYIITFLILGSNYNDKGSNHGQQKVNLHVLSRSLSGFSSTQEKTKTCLGKTAKDMELRDTSCISWNEIYKSQLRVEN